MVILCAPLLNQTKLSSGVVLLVEVPRQTSQGPVRLAQKITWTSRILKTAEGPLPWLSPPPSPLNTLLAYMKID